MKKNLFILASGAIVATAICISLFSHSYNPTKSTSLLSANIEALSRDEGNGKNYAIYSNEEGTYFCCGGGNVRESCDGYVPC